MIDKYEWKCIWLDKDTMFGAKMSVHNNSIVDLALTRGKRNSFWKEVWWGGRFDIISLCVLAMELESGRGQSSKA